MFYHSIVDKRVKRSLRQEVAEELLLMVPEPSSFCLVSKKDYDNYS